MSIQVGSTVIHNGVEKRVNTVMGDVVELSDGIVASLSDVSEIVSAPQSPQQVEPRMETPESRIALRNSIESFESSTSSIEMVRLLRETDINIQNIPVLGDGSLDAIALKGHMLHKALEANKIDPKLCHACNQIIPE